MYSLYETLLAFTLLHFVLQGQTCLLPHLSLDFLFLHSNPLMKRTPSSIPASRRSPGEGNGYPLQYSFLENPMERGAWQAMVHRVIESQTQLKQLSMYWHIYTAAAAAAKSLQSCPTLCDPIDGSTPGSPSLGFSRQEHWSGLPFPSPMHESEKWKWSCSVVSDSLRPHSLQTTRLLRPWDFPGKSTGEGCHCLLPYIHYHI